MIDNTVSIDDIIPERKNGERVWVVRASGGRFVQHFIKANIVAIGHIDGLSVQSDPRQIPLSDLKKFLATPSKEGRQPSKATVSNLANQVNTFISELNYGDLILTLDADSVAVGRVSGTAYCEEKGVELTMGKRVSVMPFQLRRQVVWGPKLEREKLPYPIEASLKAHQTVFCLDNHWEILYHYLFPIFRDQGHVYFSTNINQHKDIDSYSVSQLLGLFSDIEAIVKTFDSVHPETFEDLIRRFRSESSYSLTCKAAFMSEGHIWTKLGLSKTEGKRLLYFLVAWAALFGHVKIANLVELDSGLFTPEMRSQITMHVLKAIEIRGAQNIKEKLLLNLPHYDVKSIQNFPIQNAPKQKDQMI